MNWRCVFPSLLFALLSVLGLRITQGQVNVRQVIDLRPGFNGSFPSNLTAYGNSLVFSAYTTNVGRELWKYDGTGVTLISNINDTIRDVGFGVFVGNDSTPSGMTEFQGELYFSAFDPRRGGELWRTDGSGVRRVADINPDSNDSVKTNAASSWPREFTPLNGELFFSADGGGARSNYELWKVNGSATSLAANIRADAGTNYSSYPQGFTAFNGALYFMADDGVDGYELWSYAGTTANMVANINPGNSNSSSFPKGFTQFNGALYFQAYTATSGFELWRTDGTTASVVSNLVSGSGSSFPEFLTVFNGALYFRAADNVHGYELWKYDGVRLTLAADINPGSGDSFPKNLTAFENKLYFAATDGSRGWELWSFDGTNAVLATDVNGFGDSFPEQFTVFNRSLYFVATSPSTGYEIWRHDGSTTEAVTAINPGPGSSFPQNLAVFGRELCFRAADDGLSNWELWALSDGTRPPSPVRLQDVRWSAGQITFGFPTDAGIEYLIFGSETMDGDSWVLLAVRLGTGDVETYVDTAPPALRRFYRVESR